MKYTDEQRIQKIYEKAAQLNTYLVENNITEEQLLSEYSLQWLVTTPLYNIGEHVYYLSDEFKSQHDEIEWNMIAGLRHRLVHDYEGTNWKIIAKVVVEEIPILINQLKDIM